MKKITKKSELFRCHSLLKMLLDIPCKKQKISILSFFAVFGLILFSCDFFALCSEENKDLLSKQSSAVSNDIKPNDDKILAEQMFVENLADAVSLDFWKTQGTTLKKTENGLEITAGTKDPWPGISRQVDWDLSRFQGLTFVFFNPGEHSVDIHIRLDDKNSVGDQKTLTKNVSVPAKKEVTWKFVFPSALNLDVRQKLFAMRGKPGGIRTDHFSQDNFSTSFATEAIRQIIIFETQNQRQDRWELRSISVFPEKTDADLLKAEEYLAWTPDKFFPMIDRFGQFKHRNWPGKIESLEQLRAKIESEKKDNQEHQPSGWTEFGGWADGPKFKASGHFRVEKIDGKWWFIDPTGALFWSHGVDCVGSTNGVTPLSDREFYFESLPAENEPGSQFYGTSGHSVNNYYAGKGTFRTFNFTQSNAFWKYGENWRAEYALNAHERLRSWGMNTIANWSDANIYNLKKTPYTATIGIGSPRIEGSSGYWGKFVDPFHSDFLKNLRRSLENQKGTTADDPYCIGYFVDNEISWGDDVSLSKAALQSPAEQPAKIEMIRWLKEKYSTIDNLNTAWQTSLESWEKLSEKSFDGSNNPNFLNDCRAFYTVIAETYFKGIAQSVHEITPNKLYLGCRFAWTNNLAQAAGGKYCDVVSYNFYKYDLSDFKPVTGVDKPCIVGEFHFGALDRGLFHTGLCPTDSQQARADAYRKYVRSALENPYLVGTHWFQYGDQATTGRFDGENYQIGLVDICDTPYPETINAVRETGYQMYNIRTNASAVVPEPKEPSKDFNYSSGN